MPESVAERVARVIAKTQRLEPDTVTAGKTFEELGIDSLDGINILFALEGEFDLDIPDDAAREIRTVRQMIDGIEKLLEAKAAGGAPAGQDRAAEEPAQTPDKPATRKAGSGS